MSNFFLATLRQHPVAPKSKIKEIFHRKIQKEEAEKAKVLMPILDIIAKKTTSINIVTNTPEEKKIKDDKIKLLLEIETEIRRHMTQHSKFLRLLDDLLEYKFV